MNSKHRVRGKIKALTNYYIEKQWLGFDEKLMAGSGPNMGRVDDQMPIKYRY